MLYYLLIGLKQRLYLNKIIKLLKKLRLEIILFYQFTNKQKQLSSYCKKLILELKQSFYEEIEYLKCKLQQEEKCFKTYESFIKLQFFLLFLIIQTTKIQSYISLASVFNYAKSQES
ncbi:hypothetical protein pb186bvf_005078 [Paramecium bursaria]